MSLEVQIGASITGLSRGLRDAQNQVKGFAGQVDKATNSISRSFAGVGGTLTGLVSTGAMIAFGKQVLQTTAQFEKFGAVLSNTLGSQALSNLKLKELQDFAAKTPNSVAELTGAYVKLANQGFKPTGDQMRKLGDLAASTGKTFDQLAEAILDGQVGEYERLKEFGVRAKDAGDKVIFTFKGVQTTVDKSSEAIRNYITSLGDAEGVSGSMAKISETLTGQISALGDSWDLMLGSIGGNTKGVMSSAISSLNGLLGKITQINEEINTIEKYNLGSAWGDYFKQVKRAANPFANKGSTDMEQQVAGIMIAQEETTKFVSSAIAGAKTAADFGKAIAELAKRGNDYANLHLGEAGFKKGEQRAIVDQYKQGIKALQDARAKFLEESKKGPEGNFGTSSKEKTPGDILKQLGIDLAIVRLTGEATGDTYAKGIEASIGANTKAIGGLLQAGVKEGSPLIKRLQEDIKRLKPATDGLKVQMAGVAASVTASAGAINTTNLIPFEEGVANVVRSMGERLTESQIKLQEFNDKVSDLLTTGLVNTLAGVSEAIGTALANGTSVIDGVGLSLLQALGNVLSQLGVMALETGLGIKAIKASLTSLQPGPAIAAGVALMALAGIVKAKAAKMGNSMGGGSSDGSMTMPRPTSFSSPSFNATASASRIVSGNPSGGVIEIIGRVSGDQLLFLTDRARAQRATFAIR